MELKKTLIMPKGTFEMRGNLPIKEPQYLSRWQEMDLYHKILEKNSGHEAFYLHDGPPYANGDIHAGHALNKIVKDIAIRYHALKGYYTPFTPGWDTHGLPIETAVTKKGADRRQMSMVEFRKLCTEYALKQVEHQKQQMKRLGVIADWDKPYLTLDPQYERGQIQIFADMALKGYIYHGLKPVNWSYSSETALAEAEIEYRDVEAETIYVVFKSKESRGPVRAGDGFVIWTTTPWTIPANLAICLNPELEYGIYETDQGRLIFLKDLAEELIDKLNLSHAQIKSLVKGADLEGIKCQHPLYERESLVITGDHVTADAGTGCVHTAPGHGLDDYKVCQKYGIEPFCPVDEHGIMTEQAGERLAGLFYEKANEQVITMLKETGALLKSEKIVHSYPHDWRTHKPLIFRATLQWFASLSGFKDQLLKAIEKIGFTPSWGQNRLYKMIENRDDWCISRQRAWGVPIPIIYCEDGTPIMDRAVFDHIADIVGREGSSAWFAREAVDLLPDGYRNEHSPNGLFTKEKDIMDVWFDSGSSWKTVDLEQGRPFPADLYLEGNDQYRGWYNSSLILAVATTGQYPYKNIVTHGMMVDGNGEKFSKSKGNGVDPNRICDQYGADIFRLWTASVDFTQETKLSDDLIKITADSYRKIRNTFKFMLANLWDGENLPVALPAEPVLGLIDRCLLNELAQLLQTVDAAYKRFDFNTVTSAVLNFLVNDLSAFYLDISKDRLYCEKADSPVRRAIQYVFGQLVRSLAIALSPIIPFTAEEINDHLPGHLKIAGSIALSDYPAPAVDSELSAIYQQFKSFKSRIFVELENLRQNKTIQSFAEAFVAAALTEEEEPLRQFGETEMARLLGVGHFAFAGATQCGRFNGERCDRCWNYVAKTTEDKEGQQLCPRCLEALR